MSDKRAQFFLLAAALCAALVPVAGSTYRWLAAAVSGLYVLLALASYLDHRGRR